MVRLRASIVSALPGFVANGRQALHHVSSAPSKIPYGGFSPVRLQIGLPDATFAPAHRGGCLYASLARMALLCPLALPLSGGGRGCREQTDPEALGSPTGYAVPPGRRLLWPHPRLWDSLADFPCRYTASLRLVGQVPERPCFYLRILLSVPSPVPRRSSGV